MVPKQFQSLVEDTSRLSGAAFVFVFFCSEKSIPSFFFFFFGGEKKKWEKKIKMIMKAIIPPLPTHGLNGIKGTLRKGIVALCQTTQPLCFRVRVANTFKNCTAYCSNY